MSMNTPEILDGAQKPAKKKWQHFFLIVLLFGFLMMLLGELLGGILSFVLEYTTPMSDAVYFLVENYLPFIGIDLAVLLYCGLAERDLFRSFGHASRGGNRGNTVRLLLLGAILGIATNGVCILLAWLHKDVSFYYDGFDPLYLLLALAVVLIQSGAEELLTRGYMMGALRERYGVWPAVILNSLFFGALHLGNPGVTVLAIADIVLFGVAMSLAMYYLDSLWLCITVHTLWNFTQNILFGLPNSGLVSKGSLLHLESAADSVFYDTGFGVEGTVVAVAVECLLALGLVLYGLRRKKTREEL